jgi:rhomboid protease GluP
MDLQIFLALSAASLSAVFIAQMFVVGTFRLPGSRILMVQHAGVIGLAVAGAWLFPEFYGLVTAVALALTLAPLWLFAAVRRAAIVGDLKRAATAMRLAALLHPSPQLRFSSKLYAATAESTLERQLAALATLEARADPLQQSLVTAQKLRLSGDWAGLASHLAASSPAVAEIHFEHAIRAFGETGQLDRMVEAYRHHPAALTGLPQQIVMLVVLAFCGRVEAVAAQLGSGASLLPAPTQAFWLATALQAAGRRDEAQQLIRSIDPSAVPETQRIALARRLDHPLAPARGLLSPPGWAVVDAIEAIVRRRAPSSRESWRQIPVTCLLILANCAMFAVEIYAGGSQDVEVLFRLGALWPDAVLQDHEWWRLGAAMFLHAGPEHIFSNMLALWVLGGLIERSIGSLRMAVLYGLGGLISMAGVLWMMQAGWIEPNILVGASGAIFALLGAIALTRLSDYLQSRAVSDRRNLTMVGIILAIQIVIDLAVPQISFSAHGIGLVAGVVLGWLLTPRRR